jgi:hypothetical protein
MLHRCKQCAPDCVPDKEKIPVPQETKRAACKFNDEDDELRL